MVKAKPHTLKTIKEEFNEYELEDGSVLRVKQVAISFLLSEEEQTESKGIKKVNTLANFQLVTGVIPTGELKLEIQEKTPELIEVVTKDKFVKELSFKQITDNLNFYETDELVIIVRTVLNKVYLTSLKDNVGYPRYHIEAAASAEVLQKDGIALSKKKNS